MSRNLDNVPMADWEYAELQAAATWIVIQGLTTSTPLQSLIGQVMQLALQWKAKKNEQAG